jgi:plasmid stabilization system protein ParE
MSYRVLADAYEDMREIDDWVVEHFGVGFADRTQANFYDTFELLAKHSRMGVVRPDVMPAPFRFFLVRPYWIIYEPGDPLLIHRVYHAARDLNRLNLK